jgi:hypothetical protein
MILDPGGVTNDSNNRMADRMKNYNIEQNTTKVD